MDLGLTEAQEILKTAAADFVRQEYDKDTLIALENTPAGVTPELFRQAADLGWLGILIPESFGGTDRSLTDAAVLFEELGRGPVLGPHFSSSVLGTLIVLLGGTETQKQEILTGVAQGTKVLSVAVTEPHYGWNPETLHMPARPAGGSIHSQRHQTLRARRSSRHTPAMRRPHRAARQRPRRRHHLFRHRSNQPWRVDSNAAGVDVAGG